MEHVHEEPATVLSSLQHLSPKQHFQAGSPSPRHQHSFPHPLRVTKPRPEQMEQAGAPGHCSWISCSRASQTGAPPLLSIWLNLTFPFSKRTYAGTSPKVGTLQQFYYWWQQHLGFPEHTPQPSHIFLQKATVPWIKAFIFNAHLYDCTMSHTGAWAQLAPLKVTFWVHISVFHVFLSSPLGTGICWLS